VLAYLQALKADRKARLADVDIGVISPYNKQCQKLRKLLAAKNCGGVQVGLWAVLLWPGASQLDNNVAATATAECGCLVAAICRRCACSSSAQ
jgi:hypothetical protein